ncbi:hypothetical protein [Kiloniella sp. b19]|uniref:hypothetical protein n=1 Tax=Kiloniella sp. GXU_MW_B19 TaxID=3141326 RepID=UPI0031CEBFC9
MPFVSRAPDGTITSLHREMDSDNLEYLRPDHPDVLTFLSNPDGSDSKEASGEREQYISDLVESDRDMVRVLEDLISVLIDKRVIVMTDLPQAAQKKLSRRFGLRSKMQDLGGIVADSDDIMLP